MLALAIALLLAAPAATAGWRTFGSFEPDTPQDLAANLMHVDPDINPSPSVRKVYFNVENGYDQTGITPNAGVLGTRLLLEGWQWPHAFLGFWKDCNMDGYIGYGAGALIEYHASLLSAVPDTPSVCPAGASEHNDGTWVYEFIWIGPQDNVFDARDALPRAFNDTGAFIWGDSGLAGGQAGGGCYVDPPTGTFSSTGAFIGWADCLAGFKVYDAVALVDPDGSQNLKWDDRRTPHCDDSTITSVHIGLWADAPQCPDDDPGTFEDDTGRPAFSAFDCAAEPTFVVNDGTGLTNQTITDPTGGELGDVFGDDGEIRVALSDEDGDVHSVYAPGVPTVDPEGSYYDGANQTYLGAVGSCDADLPVGTFSPEAEVGNEQSAKRQTLFAFEYSEDFNHFLIPSDADPVKGDAPRYGGVAALRTAWLMPIWTANTLVSNSVIISDTDFQPQGATYYTFYARVAAAEAVAGLPGGSGTYGSEWCNVSPKPELNGGFDCDPDNWWDPAKGATAMPTETYTDRPLGQTPGAAYQLRDIDCYDGTVVSPVRVGLGDISEEGVCPTV